MADTNTTTSSAGTAGWKPRTFWGWFGKIAVLAGLGWLGRGLPGPILRNASGRLRNGWLHTRTAADAANRWVRRQVLRLALLTLVVGSVSGAMLFTGLAYGNRGVVVAGGLVGSVYLIFIWVLIKASVKVAQVAVEKSTDIVGSSVGAVLKKVGLAEGDGEALKVRFGDIDTILAKGFVVLPGVAEGFFLLALMPSIGTLVLIAALGLGAIASGLISAHIGDDMVDGWRLVKRVNFALFIVLALVAAFAFFLPGTFAKYANPGELDVWLMHPSLGLDWSFGFWGTILATLAIGAVAWVVAGLMPGEIGERLTFVVLVATLIATVVGGYRAWGSSDSENPEPRKVATASGRQAVFPSSPSGAPPATPNGSSTGMKMPKVSYKADPPTPSHSPRSAKLATKPEPIVTVPKVAIQERGDGLDTIRRNNAEIEALLGI